MPRQLFRPVSSLDRGDIERLIKLLQSALAAGMVEMSDSEIERYFSLFGECDLLIGNFSIKKVR